MKNYKTELLNNSKINIEYCSKLLADGEIVGIPTETVYGLAGDALNPEAIKKIFYAKGRPQDNPLIVHIAEISMLDELVTEIPPIALVLAKHFWPGPLTMVFSKKDIIPLETCGGLDTVGIRMPAHTLAREIIKACGKPLAAPSANISGSPSPTTAQHVFDDLNGKIPAIIDGGSCDVGVESTVISFENGGVRLLRPGFVSVDDLSEFVPVFVDKGVIAKIDDNSKAMSPGMKYKHYSPKANVIILDGTLEQFNNYIAKNYCKNTFCVIFDSEKSSANYPYLTYGDTSEEQAKQLFDRLRELDKIDAKTVYFRCPNKDGVGLAVYNRLLRAAGFEVIKL